MGKLSPEVKWHCPILNAFGTRASEEAYKNPHHVDAYDNIDTTLGELKKKPVEDSSDLETEGATQEGSLPDEGDDTHRTLDPDVQDEIYRHICYFFTEFEDLNATFIVTLRTNGAQ
jgi:hypothetical protein